MSRKWVKVGSVGKFLYDDSDDDAVSTDGVISAAGIPTGPNHLIRKSDFDGYNEEHEIENPETLARFYSLSFTNSNLVGGILTIDHTIERMPVIVGIYNHLMHPVLADIEIQNETRVLVDLTNYVGGITGTWRAVLIG